MPTPGHAASFFRSAPRPTVDEAPPRVKDALAHALKGGRGPRLHDEASEDRRPGRRDRRPEPEPLGSRRACGQPPPLLVDERDQGHAVRAETLLVDWRAARPRAAMRPPLPTLLPVEVSYEVELHVV